MIETLRQIDHQLFHLVNTAMANSFLDAFCPMMRGKPFLSIFYISLAWRLYSLYPKHFLKIALAGALTFLLTDQLSATVIKSIFHRLRPCNNPSIDVRLLVSACGSGFSFVSAHAANSFGMAAFISVLRARWQTTFILSTWASLVAFSQVYVGVHFPGDVIGGAIVGIAIGSFIGFILKTKFVLQKSTT